MIHFTKYKCAKSYRCWLLSVVVLTWTGTATVWFAASNASAGSPATGTGYHSPQEVAYSPDGSRLAVTDRTGKALLLIEAHSARILHTVALSGQAGGVAWDSDGQTVFVTEYGTGHVAQVHGSDGHVMRRLAVDRHPQGIALAPRRGWLVVANSTTDRVTILDLAKGQTVGQIGVPREPFFVAVTPDETLAVVTNLLPTGRANDPLYGAVVSLIDLEQTKHLADVALPPGASTVRQVCLSADGKWAYVAHCVGRTSVPSTQLERGWVNTNAFSIIDLEHQQLYATLLLDQVMKGAADPWGIALSADGSTLWVTLSGVHELARIELAATTQLAGGGYSRRSLARSPVEYRLQRTKCMAPHPRK